MRALPEHRREMIRALRRVILGNLPSGYVERFAQGRFIYEIPLKTYPQTYNGRPLCLAMLAVQRDFVSLYLMAVYGNQALARRFREAYERSGKTLRMGKSCVRFRNLDDIPFDVVGAAIGAVPVARFIQIYEGARRGSRSLS